MSSIGFRRHGFKRAGEFSGNGVIGDNVTGLVTIVDANGNDVLASREITLLCSTSRRLVDIKWSNGQGRYQFKDLDENRRYDVYARDYLKDGTNNFAIIGHSDVIPEVI